MLASYTFVLPYVADLAFLRTASVGAGCELARMLDNLPFGSRFGSFVLSDSHVPPQHSSVE